MMVGRTSLQNWRTTPNGRKLRAGIVPSGAEDPIYVQWIEVEPDGERHAKRQTVAKRLSPRRRSGGA
jgi:hypothetical protein